MFTDAPHAQFIPVREIKNEAGKVIGQERHYYKLTFEWPAIGLSICS